MKKDLLNKEYRDAFVAESVKTGIAFQNRALRLSNDWSQKDLGERAGKPQNVISRIEDPDYGNFTIRTLLDLASALDVALLVRFVSFGQLMQQLKDVSPEALAVPSFEKEQEMLSQASKSPENAQAAIAGLAAAGKANAIDNENIEFGIVVTPSAAASIETSGQPSFAQRYWRTTYAGGAEESRQ